MRTEILDYINTLSLGGFLLSQELPFEENGDPLYLKNLKKIYVGIPEYSTEALIRTFSSQDINSETTTIRIFFAADAKSLPTNYEALVSDLKAAKDIDTIANIYRREVSVETTFEADALVTQLEMRFTNIT
jgi:hypothetical protein